MQQSNVTLHVKDDKIAAASFTYIPRISDIGYFHLTKIFRFFFALSELLFFIQVMKFGLSFPE